MTYEIVVGDCRDVLRRLPAESVQCVVTSPPYWNLRDYKIEPSIWGGDPACQHEFGVPIVDRSRATPGTAGSGLTNNGESQAASARFEKVSAFCTLCGAWRGQLGLEPSLELYIQNIVSIFREVWRVLRKDGIVWLNLGDSYVTGTVAPHQPRR